MAGKRPLRNAESQKGFRAGAYPTSVLTMDIRDISADFYLRLNEGAGEPRACWRKARLRDPYRDDWMLVAIEPPVIGQPYGLGDEDIYHLLLATRHQGQGLFPVSQWPAHVYVVRLLNKSILDQQEFDNPQTQLIDWGVLHRTYEDAVATK
jgi:hypothetical protein